jgi:hypothetical protein
MPQVRGGITCYLDLEWPYSHPWTASIDQVADAPLRNSDHPSRVEIVEMVIEIGNEDTP